MPEPSFDKLQLDQAARDLSGLVFQTGRNDYPLHTLAPFAYDFAQVVTSSRFALLPGYSIAAVRTQPPTAGYDPAVYDPKAWVVHAEARVLDSVMRFCTLSRFGKLRILALDDIAQVDPATGLPGAVVASAELVASPWQAVSNVWYGWRTSATTEPQRLSRDELRERMTSVAAMAVSVGLVGPGDLPI